MENANLFRKSGVVISKRIVTRLPALRQDYCPFCEEHNQCDLTCSYPCADGAAAARQPLKNCLPNTV